MSVVVLVFVGTIAARQDTHADKEVPNPPEVRITSPPRWENGCLVLTLERTNHWSRSIFLSTMGPYFDLALNVVATGGTTEQGFEWVNIYGVTDIIDLDGVLLAPGATVHNDFCFKSAVWVVNLRKKTRREILVHGKLRISVSYFPSEGAFKRRQEWNLYPPTYLDPEKPQDPPSDLEPKWAIIFADIPCSEVSGKSGCAKPPTGISGEARLVPDVSSLVPERDERGKIVTDELARKFPPYSGQESELK